MQHVLNAMDEKKAETLTRIADSIHEILPESGWIVAVSAERTAANSERLNRVLDAIEDRLNQMQAQISALSFGSARPL